MSTTERTPPADTRGTATAKGLAAELALPVVLLAFAAYLGIGMVTMRIPEGTDAPGPRFFPGIIAAALLALSIAQIAKTLTVRRPVAADRSDPPGIDDVETTPTQAQRLAGVQVSAFLWIVGGFAVFALLIEILGWILAAAGLFWCVARGFGSTAPLRDLVVALTASSIAYIAFDMALGLSLPSGILGWGF